MHKTSFDINANNVTFYQRKPKRNKLKKNRNKKKTKTKAKHI